MLNAVDNSRAFTLILTLRADFFNHAIGNREFAKALKDNNYILSPMGPEELEQVIRLPAKKYGVELESGLLEILLKDVGKKAENLPLLEFALTQLWKKQKSGQLTLDAYKNIGGLQESLARHADDIFNGLTEEKPRQMKRVFIKLVRPGEGTASTRNVVKKSEFQECDWDLVTELNKEDARLLVINFDPSGEPTVEIIHEALISNWGKLEFWINDFHDFRVWQDRVKVEVKKWVDKNRDPKYLLTGAALGEAADWLNKPDDKYQEFLSGPQREFIQASLKKQKQTILRLAGLSIVSLFFAGFAGLNWLNVEISATREKLNSLAEISQFHFDLDLFEDALFEAMKANQFLEKTWWRKWIATDLKQKVKVALHRALYDSIIVKHTLQHQDQGPAESVVYSPDGQTLASTSWDATVVKIWDAQTGELLHTLRHQDSVNSVVYSPDGQTLASTLPLDATVKIWDAQTGELLHTLQHQDQGPVDSVVYSPDGQTLASMSRDGSPPARDIEDRKSVV